MLLDVGPGKVGTLPFIRAGFKVAVVQKLLRSYADRSGALGAVIGLFSGAITDSYSATLTYSTVALTVLGFAAGIVMSRIFN